MKPEGIFIFTAHPRAWSREFFFFWIKQWLRFYVAKPLGGWVDELQFGDRFFERESSATNRTYKTRQYIHVPAIREVKKEIEKAGLRLLEANGKLQGSNEHHVRNPPVFYVCQK